MATTDDDLDDLFALARGQEPPVPSGALMARVLADAEAVRRERLAAAAPPPAPVRRRGWFALLGGWPALGTLAASSVLGVSVGVAQPASLSAVAGTVTGAVLGEEVTVSTGLDSDLLAIWEG